MNRSLYKILFVTMLLLSPIAGALDAQVDSTSSLVIGMTLNASEKPVIYNGWPLLVNITLSLDGDPNSGTASVQLHPGWRSSLQIHVLDASGNATSWPFHLVNNASADTVLNADTYAKILFWLEPGELLAIPPGQYTLGAQLDSSAFNSPNPPLIESAIHGVTIAGVPDSGGVGQTTEKELLLANLEILKGDYPSAAGHVNTVLGSDPGNLTALSLSGMVMENSGDAAGALAAYAKAVNVFYQLNPNPGEPPAGLFETQSALLFKLDTATSFVVTFAAKDSSHPFFGHGSASCYYIDNIPLREVQFVRGKSYTFHMKDIPSGDRFYFSRDLIGGGVAPFTDGVSGTPADSNGVVTIDVGSATPDTLYYQSMENQFAGWKINVSDSVSVVNAVADRSSSAPKEFTLSAAYPNPFNPTTTIVYTLPRESHVKFMVFDILGRLVATLVDGVERSGVKQVRFNASKFPSGVYFYRLEAVVTGKSAPAFSQTRKMLLVK